MSMKDKIAESNKLLKQMAVPGQGIATNLNVNDCEPYVCKFCGAEFFVDTLRLVHISALQSPLGQEGLGRVPSGYVCAGCGELNSHERKGAKDERKRGAGGTSMYEARGYGRVDDPTESTSLSNEDTDGDHENTKKDGNVT